MGTVWRADCNCQVIGSVQICPLTQTAAVSQASKCRCIDVNSEARTPPDLLLAMCNSIFGKGQQAVRAGIDGVWRGLTTGA
jgi:hypothetical protein